MKPTHMLDTNMVSYIVRGRSRAARGHFSNRTAPQMPCLSAITAGEIQFGTAKNPAAHALRSLMEEFLAKIEILPWTRQEAKVYGTLREELRASGKALANLDLPIAAHAASTALILVTSDRAFQHVAALRGIEDWATDLRTYAVQLQPRIPVIAKLGPIIVRFVVGVGDKADALDLLVPIFDGHMQPKRGAMILRQRLAGHFRD